MNILSQIREKIESTKSKLDLLRLNGSLDDLDKIRAERIALKEDLEILNEAENSERQKVIEEEIKQKGRKRKAALKSLISKTESAISEHEKLTDKSENLIRDLISVLISRERLFTQEKLGLNQAVFKELFTQDEFSNLVYEMRGSAVRIYPGEFSKSFRKCIDELC